MGLGGTEISVNTSQNVSVRNKGVYYIITYKRSEEQNQSNSKIYQKGLMIYKEFYITEYHE